MSDIWEKDRLGYQDIGSAFTNLIKSIDAAKVISIEAGFGRGKTFFRRAWSQELRRSGEVVVELDVQQSDHSGDPVITLLGALVEAVPKTSKSKARVAFESAKKIGGMSARSAAKMVLRSGAEEVIDAFTDKSIDALGDFDALDNILKDFGDGMSKAAGQLIASQMAAEKVRKAELPKQLEALHNALVKGHQSHRVVILVDELDRCHPNYAIEFLEAMKLVFAQSGFVFCLMVNADYLEKLAQHRFGASTNDEKYLDKFVDLRLKLAPKEDVLEAAVADLASELPLKIPYGESEQFSVEHAAQLAGTLAVHTGLSMRKVKRILLKVELALRCYADQPLDASLLVFLAFRDQSGEGLVNTAFLKRSFLTPEEGLNRLEYRTRNVPEYEEEALRDRVLNDLVNEKGPELAGLPKDRYRVEGGGNWKPWALVFKFLAPHYIPFHRDVLDSVAAVLASED